MTGPCSLLCSPVAMSYSVINSLIIVAFWPGDFNANNLSSTTRTRETGGAGGANTHLHLLMHLVENFLTENL